MRNNFNTKFMKNKDKKHLFIQSARAKGFSPFAEITEDTGLNTHNIRSICDKYNFEILDLEFVRPRFWAKKSDLESIIKHKLKNLDETS